MSFLSMSENFPGLVASVGIAGQRVKASGIPYNVQSW